MPALSILQKVTFTKSFSKSSPSIARCKSNSLIAPCTVEAVKYDAIGITAEQYDGKEITAYVYDWFGRLVLTSGDYSITAGDYDSLQLTAMDYDMIGMTAIVYDYQAYRVLHSY